MDLRGRSHEQQRAASVIGAGQLDAWVEPAGIELRPGDAEARAAASERRHELLSWLDGVVACIRRQLDVFRNHWARGHQVLRLTARLEERIAAAK